MMNTKNSTSNIKIDICRWKYDSPFAYSITYDEGTVDALANAMPVHEKYGIPGHVNVVVGQLGQKRNAFCSSLNAYYHMGVDELKIFLSRGWGIGNHSWSHYVYPCQPGLNLYREIVWSKYRLEDMLDYPVRIFVIPNDSYNYEPVIDMVKQHYLACVNIEGSPNRDGFDLYNVGNFIMGSGVIPKRPGWPEELKTDKLGMGFLKGSWLYETTHLVMWNVPQDHKCVTPEYLVRRFEKLQQISEGKMWAAKPDDIIDYIYLRRNLKIEDIRSEKGEVAFEVRGNWPVGVINSTMTLRISGADFTSTPVIDQRFYGAAEGYDVYNLGYSAHNTVESVKQDGGDWLVTLQLAPGRTIKIKQQ